MAFAVERVSVVGTWWRHAPHGADPVMLPDPPPDGRWQRGARVAAAYFADEEATAWAEWCRLLAELALPPDRALPRDLWRWRIDVSDIADLSTAAKLTRLELPMPAPAQRTWPPFQRVGERLHREGYRGVLYPSAARPDHTALCIFRDGTLIPGAEPLPPPTTHREAPAPPSGLRT